jgi:VWFA-related protein
MPKALAALLAAAIVAQGPQPPTFRARADLVQVDVVVVDAKGDPVRGLRAADFTLFDRKKPQEIANFDEVSHARPVAAAGAAAPPRIVAQDVSSNQTVQAHRLIVMVIDDLHIYKERTARAREIAARVLDDLGHQSSMAVLFTSGEHSTQVVQDRARLAAAVDTLRGRQSWRRPTPAVDRQRSGRIDPEMSAEQQLAIVQTAQDTKLQNFADNMAQYKTLQDAARLLGGGDARRKAFVLISEGIGKDLSGLFGAMAPAGSAPQGGAEYATSGSVPMATPDTPYHDFALIDMMEALRRANVATYAIDPRGKVESKDLARECFPPPPSLGRDPCSEGLTDWNSPVRQAQQGLDIVSQASGGFAVTNTDDFAGGLKRIVDDLDHYYLLGFYPADTKGKGYRPIDVRVPGHPDWTLRFRHGYMPGGAKDDNTTANEMVALSAGVLPKTDLPLRLAAMAMPGSGATARIVLALEVTAPVRVLEEGDGRLRDTLKYEVLIVDEKKAKVRSVRGLEGRITLSPNAAAGPATDAAAYQVNETIDVQPGRYEFRVSATSAKLGKGGSVYLGVDVPDFRSAPIVLGGLSLGYADGARVAVAPAPAPPPAPQRGARVVTPVAAARPVLPFPPTLDREFIAADTLRVYVEGTSRSGAAPTAAIEVVDAAGNVLRSPSPSFVLGDPIRVHGVVPLAGLAPGAYVLRVTLSGGATRAVRESGFAIR